MSAQPTKFIVVSDPAKDQDDEDTMVLASELTRKGLVRVAAVVTNTTPSLLRAQLALGTLKTLGHHDIPVGAGSDCNQPDTDTLQYQFEVDYLSSSTEIVDGQQLLEQTIYNAEDGELTILVISALTEVADALRRDPTTFKQKVREVVHMGGVLLDKDTQTLDLDASGRLQPDPSAQNNKFDMGAAEYVYRVLQDLGIPLTVVTRHAAGAAKVPREIYDRMAATGHPVGVRVLKAQREAIQRLWERTNMAADNPNRQLPNRCDPTWFRNAFLGGDGDGLTGEDNIWNQVKTFNLYDPVAAVAAVPDLQEWFFAPYQLKYNGTTHSVIGLNAKEHGVLRPQALSDYLVDSLVTSLDKALDQLIKDAIS